MTGFKVCIKMLFGSFEVSGDTTLEVLDTLEKLDQEFIAEINEKVSTLLVTQVRDDLTNIVHVGRDGPVIVTKKKMTHYEAIGLILYGMRGHQSSSKEIKKRLAASGRKVIVPARIHEMRKRGHIFKPIKKGHTYMLSTRGVKWIEEEVLNKLKKR